MTVRVDAALAARGLARSRTHAQRLIDDGVVTADGVAVVKASTPVSDDAVLAVAASDHYVSRAAHKLAAALDAFGIDPFSRVALDMGASTGGFTQVLRERGARLVIAVDVGHGQLAPTVRDDSGVRVVEGFNVRDLSRESLEAAAETADVPDLVTGDLSFISLTQVLPAAARTAADDADLVLLVKPQFEVGRTRVREGVVTDPGLRADAVAGVLWAAWDAGLGTFGVIASPIAGTHGNREFLVHLRRRPVEIESGANPSQWMRTVNELAGAE